MNSIFKNLDNNKEDEIASLNDLYLSDNNPRYTMTILNDKDIIKILNLM